MLSAPITPYNLLIGEIIWAGSKGLFFSAAVLLILSLFGLVPLPAALVAPLIGLFTGLMFGSLAMLITTLISNINQFNFYFTGFISPMFFFSGVVFPIGSLPKIIRPLAEIFPLTHSVRLVRSFCNSDFKIILLWDCCYIIFFTLLTAYLAIERLKRRLVK
jgi:lipooligosaccharide transport system permease protein